MAKQGIVVSIIAGSECIALQLIKTVLFQVVKVTHNTDPKLFGNKETMI